MGVIIDMVYCNIYQCFLAAQGDAKKKGATTCKKNYFEKKFEIYISIGSSTLPTHANSKTNFTLLPDMYDL
jgi:hypothetical protein